jgi:hypothetical protein
MRKTYKNASGGTAASEAMEQEPVGAEAYNRSKYIIAKAYNSRRGTWTTYARKQVACLTAGGKYVIGRRDHTQEFNPVNSCNGEKDSTNVRNSLQSSLSKQCGGRLSPVTMGLYFFAAFTDAGDQIDL